MEMLGKVRRMHLRDQLSLHEISKRTGLSRTTLRKWLRKPEAEVVAPLADTGRYDSLRATGTARDIAETDHA